jgi:hypothetical protein
MVNVFYYIRITYGNMVPKCKCIRFNRLFKGIRGMFVNEGLPLFRFQQAYYEPGFSEGFPNDLWIKIQII